jgi:hypothetical protein
MAVKRKTTRANKIEEKTFVEKVTNASSFAYFSAKEK